MKLPKFLVFAVCAASSMILATPAIAETVTYKPQIQTYIQDVNADRLMEGWDYGEHPFSFVISTASTEPLPQETQATTDDTGVVTWGDIDLETNHTYSYTIQQTFEPTNYITQDTAKHLLEVGVSESGHITEAFDGTPIDSSSWSFFDTVTVPKIENGELRNIVIHNLRHDGTCIYSDEGYTNLGSSTPGLMLGITDDGNIRIHWRNSRMKLVGNTYQTDGWEAKDLIVEPMFTEPGSGMASITNSYEIPTVPYALEMEVGVLPTGGDDVLSDWDFDKDSYTFEISSSTGAPLPTPNAVTTSNETASSGVCHLVFGEVELECGRSYTWQIATTEESGKAVEPTNAHELRVSVSENGTAEASLDGSELGTGDVARVLITTPKRLAQKHTEPLVRPQGDTPGLEWWQGLVTNPSTRPEYIPEPEPEPVPETQAEAVQDEAAASVTDDVTSDTQTSDATASTQDADASVHVPLVTVNDTQQDTSVDTQDLDSESSARPMTEDELLGKPTSKMPQTGVSNPVYACIAISVLAAITLAVLHIRTRTSR